MKIKMDRIIGPITSVVLNGLIIFCLYHFVKFAVNSQADKIDVMVMEIEEVDLEEFEEQLEDLQELDTVMDNEVITEVEVDTETPEVTEETADVDDFQNLDVMNDFSSPVVMKGLFANRGASGRAASLKNYAGRYGAATERAVVKGLEWLRTNQSADGSWDSPRGSAKNAITALGLMAFLAHGETPSSERYGRTVEQSIKWLLNNQDHTGRFVGGNSYNHVIVTYALAEAYAMTRIPKLKPAMEKGVQVMLDGIGVRVIDKRGSLEPVPGRDQRGGSTVHGGGYGYSYDADEKKWDSSVMGWHAQALKAAKLAGAKNANLDETLILISNGLKFMQTESGRILYTWESSKEPGNSGDKNMTSVGTLALQLLGHGKSKEVAAGLTAMSEFTVDPQDYKSFYYRNYYTTQAKFHAGKGAWRSWNSEFAPIFTKLQEEDGSWLTPPHKPKGDDDGGHHNESKAIGPAFTTSMAALSLMVYYRNLPTFQEKAISETMAENEDSEDVELEIL